MTKMIRIFSKDRKELKTDIDKLLKGGANG